MRLIVVRKPENGAQGAAAGMLEYALSTDPVRRVILGGTGHLWCTVLGCRGFSKSLGSAAQRDCLWVVPQSWQDRLEQISNGGPRYATASSIDPEQLRKKLHQPWLVVSNGRYAAHINGPLFEQVLAEYDADALAVTATADLLAYRERVRLTEQGDLVGYRRFYRDSMEPIPVPRDWPHHFFIRRECAQTVLGDGVPEEFGDMIERCRSHQLNVRAVAIAGSVVDLDAPEGLLALSEVMLKHARLPDVARDTGLGDCVYVTGHDNRISSDARFVGPVLIGSDVRIEPGAVIVGPSILCDHSAVCENAVVDSSILGTQAVIEANETVSSRVVGLPGQSARELRSFAERDSEDDPLSIYSREPSVFRAWARLSYAGCFKRIADAVAAAIVLILFMPIIPLIAIAVKMSSPGPVFFKDKRQGLHGRLFDCIKFRTMRVGAAEIQDKLRFVCEVDGPQFKMADDPRISTVGWFLRETYLDEIPQFFNVLCGQMSVVGPRPSPESENTLCPSWRDARLSVRPGITGLWQVNRTRRPFRDFQEWIHFDTQYVRQLSPRMDLWICWRTFRKMVENFIHQF